MGCFKVRCALTREPFDAGEEVQAILLEEPEEGSKMHGLRRVLIRGVVTGEMNDYGEVIKDGQVVATYENAMLVSAAASRSFQTGHFFAPYTAKMKADLTQMAEDLIDVYAQENLVLTQMKILTIEAKTGLSFGVLNVTQSEIHQKDEDAQNAHRETLIALVDLMAETMTMVPWLPYAEDLFDIQIQTSADDYTHMSKAMHIQIQNGMSAAMRDAEHARALGSSHDMS